jgi:hypothetical protein
LFLDKSGESHTLSRLWTFWIWEATFSVDIAVTFLNLERTVFLFFQKMHSLPRVPLRTGGMKTRQDGMDRSVLVQHYMPF